MDKSIELGVLFTGNSANLITSINSLRTAITNLTTAAAGTGAKINASTRNINNLKKSYDNATKAADKFTKKQKQLKSALSNQVGAINRLKSAFKTLSSYLVAGAGIRTFVISIQNGITAIKDFDQALKNLQAITGATDAQLASMKATLLDLASRSKFSVSELSQGMVLLGQSGFTASESIQAIGAVSDLATGTLSSLATTADLLTTSLRAYNLSAIESGRVSDVMANAVTKSKLTVDKLRVAFNYVAATASQAGLSLEETAATMMVLANNGLRASTIGTGLRQVLAKMIAPSKKLRDVFADYNIELSKINPTIVGYQSALKQLSKVLWDSEKGVVNMNKAFDLFKLRGAQAAAVIVKSYMGGSFQAALDNLYKVGTATEMAAKQSEGLGVMWKRFKDNAGNLAVALGDAGLLGVFKGIALVLKGTMIGATTALTNSFGKFTAKVILVTGAILSLGTAIAVLAPMVAGLFAKFALPLLINPWVLYTAAIVAAGLAIHKLANYQNELILSKKQEVVALSKTLDGYKLYTGALENLAEKYKKGENVQKEYEAVLKRLKKQYPELTKFIDKNSYSIENLVEKMKLLKQDEHKKVIQGLIDVYKLQEEQLERLSIQYGDIAPLLSNYKDLSNDTKESIVLITGAIIEMGKSMGLSSEDTIKLAEQLGNAEKNGKAFAQAIKDEVVKSLEAAEKAMHQFTKSLSELKLPEIDVTKVLNIEDADVKMQAAFHKMQATLQREISAIEKSYKNTVGMEKEKNYEIEQARINHVMKLVELDNKEIMSATELVNKKKQVLNELVQATRKNNDEIAQLYAEQTTKNIETVKQLGLTQIEENAKLVRIKTEYNAKMAELDNQRKGDYVAFLEEYKNLAIENYKETEGSIADFYTTLKEQETQYYAESLAQLNAAHEEKLRIIAEENVDHATKLKETLAIEKTYWEAKEKLTTEYKGKLQELTQSEEDATAIVEKLTEAENAHADAMTNAQIAAEALKDTTEQLAQIDSEYALRLADLDLAYEKHEITKKEHDQRELRLEKEHWEAMLVEREAGLQKLEAAGLKGFKEYNKALLAIRKDEIKLEKINNKLAGSFADVSKKAGVAGKGMKEGFSRAAEGGDKAINIWQQLADLLGTTVERIKSALGELTAGVNDAQNSMSQFEKTSNKMKEDRDAMSDWLWGGEEGAGSSMRKKSTKFDDMSLQQLELAKKNIKDPAAQWGTGYFGGVKPSLSVTDIKALEHIDANIAKITGETQTQTNLMEQEQAQSSQMGGGYASGGIIPGTGNKDTIPVMVTPGEFVINKDAVSMWKKLFGKNFMKGINNPMSNVGQKIKNSIATKKYSTGGEITNAIKNGITSATQSLSQVNDMITLNFNINNKQFTGTYERSIGSALVAELQKASLVAG